MSSLKRLGASLLALGVVAASMVMTAPLASAHTTHLRATSTCQQDGTYLVTYTGTTSGTGGRRASLTLSQILPAGTTITDAPATVTGDTTYGFTETVPGKMAASASARVDFHWTDGANAHYTATTALAGDCTTPVAPSGNLQKNCGEDNLGHVWAGKLDNGTAENVSWRLVSGTNAVHDTVVGGPTAGLPLASIPLDKPTKVWLQYKIGDTWTDEGSVVTTASCTPVVVAPTGSFTVVCTETGASVTIGALDSGTKKDVEWTLTYNDSSKTVVTGDVVAVPALAVLALSWTSGSSGATVQTGTAPHACPPTGTVDKSAQPASGSVVCTGRDDQLFGDVTDTGAVKIVDKPAVDTLPASVSLVAGSISTAAPPAPTDGRSPGP